MAAFTLETAQAQLAAYLAAEEKVLLGQSASLPNGNQLTLADLGAVQAGVKLWAARVAELENRAAGRTRCRTVAPRW